MKKNNMYSRINIQQQGNMRDEYSLPDDVLSQLIPWNQEGSSSMLFQQKIYLFTGRIL